MGRHTIGSAVRMTTRETTGRFFGAYETPVGAFSTSGGLLQPIPWWILGPVPGRNLPTG